MNENPNFIDKDQDLIGKKVKTVPTPEQNVGVDTTDTLLQEVVYAGEHSTLGMSEINKFTQVSQRRENIYQLIDSMCQDPIVSSILETYTEDATEYNQEGHIMWVESSSPEIAKFVTFLLDSINVDKNAYSWIYSLCKYGDLYLRLYRESDMQDAIFSDVNGKTQLNEAIKVNAYSKNDRFSTYVEKVPNPAEMFELTKYGKTYGFVSAPVMTYEKEDSLIFPQYKFSYNFNQKDINIYGAREFVHAALDNGASRIPEEVNISSATADDESSEQQYTYSVRRGQSLFQNVFKVWRELMLLKNSILLNRVTKSSIVRVVSVEVADMPKSQVEHRLRAIKNLMEQKTSFEQNDSMSEYTNPGPIENNIYIPTRNGQGRIETSTVGGDVDVKSLADLDFFNNEFYGAMRVPKAYFGFTDDGAGFNGGQSLAIISSRYAKMIKRIQNAFIQTINDLINIILIDRGLDNYVNRFTLHMTPPATQEEIERRDNLSNQIGLVRDIMQIIDNDVEDTATKLKIEKAMFSNLLTNSEVIDLLQEEIDRLEAEEETESPAPEEQEEEQIDIDFKEPSGRPPMSEPNIHETGNEPEQSDETEEPELGGNTINRIDDVDSETLPNPSELDIDFTDNNQ